MNVTELKNPSISDDDGRAVVFYADLGVTAGLGHFRRCCAIADALKQRGFRSFFALPHEAAMLQDVVRGSGHGQFVAAPNTPAWQAKITELRPASIVFDTYQLDDSEIEASWDSGVQRVLLDDDPRVRTMCDIIINPNAGWRQNDYAPVLRAHGDHVQTMVLAGARYGLLGRQSLRLQPRRMRDVGAAPIVVTCGGSDPTGATMPIINALPAGIKTQIIVGPANPKADDICAYAAQSETMTALVNPAQMQQILASAGIVICAAGVTLWEALYLGAPCIALIVADNQVPGALAAQQARACITIDMRDDDYDAQLKGAIRRLCANHVTRQNLSDNARALIDGKGAQRVAEKMVLQMSRANVPAN